MESNNNIRRDYYGWIIHLICGNMYAPEISFKRLLKHLYSVPFTYTIPNDENRAEDGIDLRYRWAIMNGYDDVPQELDGPCSVLEMMVALAIRCEESLMDDPSIGDRTKYWFWLMINNLGLGGMTNDIYDPDLVDGILYRFLNRDYDRDGNGGLFRIRDCKYDLRNVEIWCQLNWYINTIV